MCKVDGTNRASSAQAQAEQEKLPTIGELRKAVPAHCFEKSTLKSLFFVARDLAFCSAIGYAAWEYIPVEWSIKAIALWTLYAIVQGTVATGVWVLGHEGGHGGISSYSIVNDTVGYVLHSILLVPYFSWQDSHRRHHARCNHLLDGESHNPDLKRKVYKMYEKILDTVGEDAFVIMQIVLHLVLGWPMYLLMHATGSRRSPVTGQKYTKKPNHFNWGASNEQYPAKLRFKIFLSSLGVIATLAGIAVLANKLGAAKVSLMYFGPYLVVNAWLVGYTWLQHTDQDAPHYGEDEWTWIKGAMTTIDRPYPWIVDELHHHIGTTHVCHHLFSDMPHYKAQEATEALKPVLGKHYRFDPTPLAQAMWNTARDCHYVEGLDGVQYPQSIIAEKRAAKKL
uniref:Delta12-fatty acid desaturase n=1 Tax=Thraustochytrium aureum TaxID=42467 RepID=J7MCI6_9STRA|nr:delta12-fatty acid desaturase [Thraustochytrium aureum]